MCCGYAEHGGPPGSATVDPILALVKQCADRRGEKSPAQNAPAALVRGADYWPFSASAFDV
jgi:hypothetical protein